MKSIREIAPVPYIQSASLAIYRFGKGELIPYNLFSLPKGEGDLAPSSCDRLLWCPRNTPCGPGPPSHPDGNQKAPAGPRRAGFPA